MEGLGLRLHLPLPPAVLHLLAVPGPRSQVLPAELLDGSRPAAGVIISNPVITENKKRAIDTAKSSPECQNFPGTLPTALMTLNPTPQHLFAAEGLLLRACVTPEATTSLDQQTQQTLLERTPSLPVVRGTARANHLTWLNFVRLLALQYTGASPEGKESFVGLTSWSKVQSESRW